VVDWEHDTLMEAAGVKGDAPARAENTFAIIKDTLEGVGHCFAWHVRVQFENY
jgi:hypothetical protein